MASPFPGEGSRLCPNAGGVTGMWGQGRGWPHHCVPADICRWPRPERAAPWGKLGCCARTDLRSRKPRAAATATAGTGTWTGAARHAGGVGTSWRENGNGLSSLSGTVLPAPVSVIRATRGLRGGGGRRRRRPASTGPGRRRRPRGGPMCRTSLPFGEGGLELYVGLLPLNSPASSCDCTSLLHQRSSLFANSQVSKGNFHPDILIQHGAKVIVKMGAQKAG